MKLSHLLFAVLCLHAAGPSSFAAITMVRSYHLGDLDVGAADAVVATNSGEFIGTNTLTIQGAPKYSAEVPPDYPLMNTYSLDFTGSNHGSAPVVSNLTDNFGLSAWVKPRSLGGNRSIVYNGNTGASGWGLFQLGGTFGVLYGGVATFGSAPVTTNVWTHLALVRDNGVATLYVNGVAAGTSAAQPNAPEGLWAIGAKPPSLDNEFFDGRIDEVALFTFAQGTFSTNDLGYAPPATRVLTAASDGNNLLLTWPTNHASFQLEYTTNFTAGSWEPLPHILDTNTGRFMASETFGPGERFYRLCKARQPIQPVLYLNRTFDGGFLRNLVNTNAIANISNGSQTVEFDASLTLNPRTATAEAVRFFWTIKYPSVYPYACVGITGYHRPILKALTNAMASQISSPVEVGLYVKDSLEPRPAFTFVSSKFRILSDLSLTKFSTCQSGTNACPTCDCDIAAALPIFSAPDPADLPEWPDWL